jgi:hypothetical protein
VDTKTSAATSDVTRTTRIDAVRVPQSCRAAACDAVVVERAIEFVVAHIGSHSGDHSPDAE